MTNHLVSMLFAAHGAGWPEAGRPVRLRMDHVLLDEDDGLVALLAFESLGRARHACDLALVAPWREADGPDARDDLRYLQAAASAIGASFVRPGAGAPAAVHRRGFALPGRTMLAGVAGAAGAGAFAMLVLEAAPTEAATVLAGEPLRLDRPRVVGVRLGGAAPRGVGGAEALAALARRLDGLARGAIVEYSGDGLDAWPMSERIAMAALGGTALGAIASVFPSDALTHAYMGARGREADWRRTGGGGEGYDAVCDFDLSRLAAPAVAPARVRFGVLAEDDDLRALARAAREGGRLENTEVIVGGRATRDALAAADDLAAIEAAGGAVRDAGDGRAHEVLESGTLACGDDAEVASARATACSAAGYLARLGFEPPIPAAESPARRDGAALAAAEVIAPAPADEHVPVERGAAHVPPAASAAFEGAPRGVVLRADPGDVAAEDVLARGPRARARRGDASALAALSSRFADAEAAERVQPGVWNMVTAAGRYGDGEAGAHEACARATRALGIRVVIAREFAPAHARALAVQGVLTLCWSRAEDAGRVSAGDELELPGIADALVRGTRVAVRNLTRGDAFATRAAMDDDWREVTRLGGLLAAILRAPLAVAGD